MQLANSNRQGREYVNPAVSLHTVGHIVLPSSQFSLFFSLYADNHLYLFFLFCLRHIFSFYRNTAIKLFSNFGANCFPFLVIQFRLIYILFLIREIHLPVFYQQPLPNFLFSVCTNLPYSYLRFNPPFYIYFT
jgi:hypothetical protein